MVNDILIFLTNPYAGISAGKSDSIRRRLIILMQLLIYCLLFSFTTVFIIVLTIEPILNSKFGISIFQNLKMNIASFRNSGSPIETFLKVAILGPFEEEVIFRLVFIVRNKFLIFLIVIGFISHFVPGEYNIKYFTIPYYLILVITILLLYLDSISRKLSGYQYINDKRYNLLVWISMISFALVHVGNFSPVNWNFILLYPIYVLPQFIYGVAFSYLTVRYNTILWSVLLHAAINSTSEIHRLLNDIL